MIKKIMRILSFIIVVPNALAAPEQKDIESTGREFEAQVLAHMLKQIYPKSMNPLGKKTAADKIMRDMLLDEYGKILAQGKGIGIAKQITRDISKKQFKREDSHERSKTSK